MHYIQRIIQAHKVLKISSIDDEHEKQVIVKVEKAGL
jgi:hypothetical protein